MRGGGRERAKDTDLYRIHQPLLTARVLCSVPHTLALAYRSYWPHNDLLCGFGIMCRRRVVRMFFLFMSTDHRVPFLDLLSLVA
jgi:hypothetical protein